MLGEIKGKIEGFLMYKVYVDGDLEHFCSSRDLARRMYYHICDLSEKKGNDYSGKHIEIFNGDIPEEGFQCSMDQREKS